MPERDVTAAGIERERKFLFSAGGLLRDTERDFCAAAAKLGVDPEDVLQAFYGPEPDDAELAETRDKASQVAEDDREVQLFTQVYVRYRRMIWASSPDAERSPEQRALLRAVSIVMRNERSQGAAPRETSPLAIAFGIDSRLWSRRQPANRPRNVSAPRRRRTRTRARARSPGRPDDSEPAPDVEPPHEGGSGVPDRRGSA